MPIPPPTTAIASTATTATANSSHAKRPDQHKYRRRFIGPIPETVLLKKVAKPNHQKRYSRLWHARSLANSQQEDDILQDVVRDHALDYFLGHGGRIENWNEDEDRRVREIMLKRWKDSEWGQARKAIQWDTTAAKKWIGTSFDVGVFLGVNLLDETASRNFHIRAAGSTTSTSRIQHDKATATKSEMFTTARSEFTDSSASEGGEIPPVSEQMDQEGTATGPSLRPDHSSERDDRDFPSALSADSTTALLEPPSDGVAPLPQIDPQNVPQPSSSILRMPSHAQTAADSQAKANRPRVHYADIPATETPAPPREVLARSGSEVPNTSAAAAQQAAADHQTPWGEVIMRDRMLVRVSYTELENVPNDFDEKQNRTTGHLQDENWAEYIVAWRKDRVEVYRDHSFKAQEWLTGHKCLAYVIPLGLSSTRLSLYSFVDMTFCIVCAPAPLPGESQGRQFLSGTRKGLEIFVFKLKSRTRAIDWYWKLWHHLVGKLPNYVEIRCPSLDTRIKIDVSGSGGIDIKRAYAIFDRANLLNLCERWLRNTQDYHEIVERELSKGARLEFAWCFGTYLDWVWQLEDVQEKPRQWAVLYGLAMKQGGNHCHLELRLNAHNRKRLLLKDGTRMDEPMAIEGFLDRIKPNSQLKQAVYLSTHEGYLFVLHPSHAHQPLPPGPLVEGRINADFTNILRRAEVARGTRQVTTAVGVIDIRNIVAVRRAFQPVMRNVDDNATRASQRAVDWEDTPEFWNLERSTEDEKDEGGDDGLAQSSDRSGLRMRRSFELVLQTGGILRYEAFSCSVALEWIVRLRSLVSYWRKRHQADAHLEMDIVQLSAGRPRVTPLRHVEEVVPNNMSTTKTSLPELGILYNWCVLEDCRAILKCGRIFSRKGLRGQYRHMQLVLVSGHLVQYRVTTERMFFHRRDKIINLLDAYVCSGYLAARYLPEGQYNPDAPPVARRYQDGLETEDSEEDTLFMIWYHTFKVGDDGVGRNVNTSTSTAASAGPTTAGSGQGKTTRLLNEIPALNAKRKIGVFRTRSKLERDAWVWAINSEIEKVLRIAKEREDVLRDAGELAAWKD